MTIRIYNTLSKKKEDFEPIKENIVNMYVCGPTVYDSCHVGHARSVVVFDVITRYLRTKGYKVTYVRNFTDIDDKIINRAKELNISHKELAKKYIDEFYQDMDALNVARATSEPCATKHIDRMIWYIEHLIEKKLAYEAHGDVYFAVKRFQGYGKLSGRKLEDMKPGARIDVNEKKLNPMDFALWKSAKKGEPFWESPWGKGRPGWHIECSAMSYEFFGDTLDIHGGGKDLIFPHHDNELAQSEGLLEKPFAKYWIHNGFVNINNEKMSKSLGNFMIIRDILSEYHSEAVRLFLLSSHYRSPLEFTNQNMDDASSGLDRIYALLERMEKVTGLVTTENKDLHGKSFERFCLAMDDDFNTAKGIGILFDTIRALNRLLDKRENKPSKDDIHSLSEGRADILRMGDILGILSKKPEQYFMEKKKLSLMEEAIDSSEIEEMIAKREEARRSKNWEEADQIRKELTKMNIILEDSANGTIWKVKN